MRKPAPLPIIDLAATYQVIDDTTTPPKWKTIGRGYTTEKTAQQLMNTHHLPGIWAVDDCGYRTYYSRER